MADGTVNPAAPPVLFSTLLTASGNRFGHATLHAPSSLNALSQAMVDRLDPQLAAWATDEEIVGVVLDATGDKAFCAGGDVVDLYRSIRETPAGETPLAAARFFETEYRLDHRIHRYPKPFLCWAHGIVMGGGLGLMAGASHRVATPKTRLAMPEISLGLYPDVGGSWLLPRLPDRTGLFVGLTGVSLNAADTRFAGLTDHVVPHKCHGAVLEALSAARWHGDADADRRQLSHLLEAFGASADGLAPSPLQAHHDAINALIGDARLQDFAPRLAALSGASDAWLASAGRVFSNGSPTSLALTFEMQDRARHLPLADTFRLEWQASVGCCRHHDFAEGVRALLIDKDKQPRWQPATLAEVTPALIDAHLAPVAGPHPLTDLT